MASKVLFTVSRLRIIVAPLSRDFLLKRCLAYYWNWFNSSAVDYYIDQYVTPIVAQPGFDAIFFDGADEWMRQGSHTWAVSSHPKSAAPINLISCGLSIADIVLNTNPLD